MLLKQGLKFLHLHFIRAEDQHEIFPILCGISLHHLRRCKQIEKMSGTACLGIKCLRLFLTVHKKLPCKGLLLRTAYNLDFSHHITYFSVRMP